MSTVTSIAEQERAATADGLAADRRMALLAQAFEIELAEADHADSWSMGKTIWLSVLVSGALWALIIGIIRLI